jgi:hypothetical protein
MALAAWLLPLDTVMMRIGTALTSLARLLPADPFSVELDTCRGSVLTCCVLESLCLGAAAGCAALNLRGPVEKGLCLQWLG